MYSKEDFTYGYEIEWGDIPRSAVIPEHLGSWEHAECDIVNLRGEYRGLACDPLGIEPPVGGEINTKPTHTWQEQVSNIETLKLLLGSPTASVVNHGHLHVHVPNLKDDVEALKRLTRYVLDNQALTIEKLYQFEDSDEIKQDKAKTYLKWDGGRPMPDWMANNIIHMANNFDDFIRIQCCGKDGVSRGRPFRYAINTYCLKHTNTIEFRCFRSSTNPREIADSFKFAEEFIYAALNTGKPVEQILSEYDYKFPPFNYDSEMFVSWKNTKYDKERGSKVRKFYDVA